MGMGLLFPLRLLLLRGVVYLSMMAAAVWGMTQYQGPSIYFLSSLPKSFHPQSSLRHL